MSQEARLWALVAQMNKYAAHEILYRDLAVGQRIQEWVAELEALLSAPVVSGWQPIETVPSGMPVLLWWPEWSRDPCVGRFVRNRWESDIAVSGAGRLPTHWMPLPAAPIVTQEGEEQK